MKTIKILSIIFFGIVMGACGKTTDDPLAPVAYSLSGTAAQGAAIASATVTIKDKNGSTQTGTTGIDGKYTIDVTGKTPPFLLKVPAGTGYLYSVATATGTANIHPFTDLIIRNWYKVQGSNVETDFSGTSALAKVPTTTEINTIEAVIRSILSTNLTNVGLTASNFNLLTATFVADHTGFDKVLDNTKVDVSTTGAVTVTATDPTTGISGTMVSTNLTTDLSAADVTPPSDPTGLSAIPASASSIVIVWNATTDNVGVAGYNIYRGATKVGTSPYPVYSDTGLTSSTNYCYQTEAFDGAGNVSLGKSASVCATTLAAADATAPSAPSSLTATAASASRIELSWTASASTDVAGYAIYRDGVKVAAVNGTSYNDTGLSSGTLYTYTVKALDGALNLSAASNTTSATTQSGTSTLPLAPTGITASAGNGRVTISWAASSGATSYNIFWSTATGVTKANGTKITGATSPYTHTGRTNGTAYYYVVTAANSSGESVESAQVSGTPATTASLVGTWGETTLDHNNDGTWATEVCKFTYNSDNTGAALCQSNYVGTLQTWPSDTFTYTAVSNPDGSLTLDKIFSDGTPKTHRWVIGDDGNVMILDGTAQSNKQRFRVAVRLDTAKTYTNADLSGDYFLERYRYNGSYTALAALSTFDGVGGRNYTLTLNVDGGISTDAGPLVGTYNVSSDGLYTMDNANTGYLLGDGKFGINTHVNDPATWSFGLSMKKGDKTYSTADLAGTWAYIKFGDNVGTSFRSMIGTMICNSTGNCSDSEKILTDGSVTYQFSATTLSVASDGSITDANNGSKISAIGNNGNAIIFNNSFDSTNPGKRRIGVFIKCSTCSSLLGTDPAIGAAFPTNVSAAAGDGQVTISWPAVNGATSYNIYWSTAAGVSKASGTKVTGATSPYIHTGRTNGTSYYYVVTAVNASGESVESTEVSVTPTIVSQFDGTYTGSWSRLCPTCGSPPPDNQSNSGTFTITVANGIFTNIYFSPPVPGAGGLSFSSGTVSSSGAITTTTATGTSSSPCSDSVSTYTGQITTSTGGADMTMTYTRNASASGQCMAESGTMTATRP